MYTSINRKDNLGKKYKAFAIVLYVLMHEVSTVFIGNKIYFPDIVLIGKVLINS